MKYWISINSNKFFEFFSLMFWSLIAFCKNCSKLSYSAVYDFVNFSFLLIHAFSKAKNVFMRLKSNGYEDKRAKIILTASHIWMNSSCEWIRALFRIKIDFIGKSGFGRPLTFVTFAVLRCICFLFVATAQVLSEWNVFAAF